MIPHAVTADGQGAIREHPSLLMLCRRGDTYVVPSHQDLEPLPRESELFLLPGRQAPGYDGRSRTIESADGLAVAAFPAPGHTLEGHPAYRQADDAPLLPLFAYGAVGYSRGKFWIAARKVDDDARQRFEHIKAAKLQRLAAQLLDAHPHNRLVGHIINNCVRRYDCPAARNFALGRYEAPLPTSRTCPARCLGCISEQQPTSPLAVTPQCRMAFVPTVEEIVEVMCIHEGRERQTPIYSFGQGCEGDPLVNWRLLRDAVVTFRRGEGKGTINCNTNAFDADAVDALCVGGLTSLRVSLNSAQPSLYRAYYRPSNYELEAVEEAMKVARRRGIFVSINLLYFPGLSDTAEEIAALARLCQRTGVSMIQLRNLNIDPEWYHRELAWPADPTAPPLGLKLFMQRMRDMCPWLLFGYFNPYLGERANITAPLPN